MMRAFAAWWEEVEIFSMRSERLIGLDKPALAEISFAEGWQAAMRQAVPEGFVVVPKEPTREMWSAVNKLDDEMAAGNYDGKGCSIEQAWHCLIAAAQKGSE